MTASDGTSTASGTFTISTANVGPVYNGTLPARSGSSGTGVSWALADGTLTISGEGNMTDFTDPRYGSSNLPSWDIYKDNIVKVVIEGGVKHVGSYAFYDYSNLQFPIIIYIFFHHILKQPC